MDIPIKAPAELFQQHLDLDDNCRVLFSGPFGIGKTYFLEKFFGQKEDDYVTIHLSPVSYSVATNEDIFKYVKYDILQELNRKYSLLEALEADFEQNYKELDNLNTNATYRIWSMLVNYPAFFQAAFHFIPEVDIGETSIGDTKVDINFAALSGLPTALSTALTKIFKNAEELKKAVAEFENSDEAKSFLEKIAKEYLYEKDPVTVFITEVLDMIASIRLNKKNRRSIKRRYKRKKILIIDDLDRIDPEHIFRLFNVFSAHLGHKNKADNKFKFDKIIFVCDVDNIRGMFNVRYGSSLGFNGYIDKFYSKQVFLFKNHPAIVEFIRQSFFKFKPATTMSQQTISQNLHKDIDMMTYMLEVMIRVGVLNLRSLESHVNNLNTPEERNCRYRVKLEDYEDTTFYCKIHNMMLVSLLFKSLFSRTEDFIEAFEVSTQKLTDTTNSFLSSERGLSWFCDIILFSRSDIHLFGANSDQTSDSQKYILGSYPLFPDDANLKGITFNLGREELFHLRSHRYWLNTTIRKFPITERLFFQELTKAVKWFANNGLFNDVY